MLFYYAVKNLMTYLEAHPAQGLKEMGMLCVLRGSLPGLIWVARLCPAGMWMSFVGTSGRVPFIPGQTSTNATTSYGKHIRWRNKSMPMRCFVPCFLSAVWMLPSGPGSGPDGEHSAVYLR
jgi:hypothetical protein